MCPCLWTSSWCPSWDRTCASRARHRRFWPRQRAAPKSELLGTGAPLECVAVQRAMHPRRPGHRAVAPPRRRPPRAFVRVVLGQLGHFHRRRLHVRRRDRGVGSRPIVAKRRKDRAAFQVRGVAAVEGRLKQQKVSCVGRAAWAWEVRNQRLWCGPGGGGTALEIP